MSQRIRLRATLRARHVTTGEIECTVLGFVGDVAGKSAEAEREFSTEVQEGADESQDAAKDEKRTTDVAKVHRKKFTRLEGKIEEG